MSDDSKPVEAVEAQKVEPEALKVEPKAPKTEVMEFTKPETKQDVTEEAAVLSAEKDDVKSEDAAEAKKEVVAEKNGDSKPTRKSRSRSPYSSRKRHDDRSRSPRRNNRNNDRRGGGRGGHRGGRGDYNGAKNNKRNIKSVYELAESSDPDEIRKQVEFYFSDSNLCRDKFLFTQTGGAENKPIPISLIHSFKRMRHFQPFSAVVTALKDSNTLEVVNDNEVKRKIPLPLDKDVDFEDSIKLIEDAAMCRSIYAKGFGEEKPNTQLAIEEFFEPFGPINMIKLRRDESDQHFKGSVFVEFESEEVMKEFMSVDPKPQWDGKDLKISTKKEYCESKIEDINSGKIRPAEQYERSNFRGRGRGGNRGRDDRGRSGGRGGRGNNDRRGRDRDGDNRDWKTRRDHDQRIDRNDRNGSRREHSASSKRETDDKGIPVVHSSPPPTTEPANGVKKEEAGDASPKKRSREDDGVGERTEAKKVKADDA